MKKLLFIPFLSLVLNASVIENQILDKFVPDKDCDEIIIKNSTISNSKLECKKVFIDNSVLKGTTILGTLSLSINNSTIRDTVSKGHIIDCVNCLEYNVFNSKFINNEGVSIIYNFGNAFIGKNIEMKNNKAKTLITNINNETMYDIWNGDKISEKKYDFNKKYDEDIKNGVFNLKQYENNYLLLSDVKINNNIAEYGIYTVRTWDYFTKNSFLENISIQEGLFGESYQRTLMKLILPYFTALENSDISNNHFSKATIASENLMAYNTKISGNIIFTESLQGFNNVFVNGGMYQGYNNNIVHSQFNFSRIKNLIINSVFIDYSIYSDKDVLMRNSLSNTPINGDTNIYKKNIDKIYEYMINSNQCGAYPFDFLKHEFFDYVFPYLNKDATFNYIGRNETIINKNEKCPYYKELNKAKFSDRNTQGILFQDSNKIKNTEKERDLSIFQEKKEVKKTTFDEGFDDLEIKKDNRDISGIRK